jgi:hypothetical protein
MSAFKSIQRQRHIATVALRALSIILLVIGSIYLIYALAISLLQGNLEMVTAIWDKGNDFSWGLGLAIPGAAILFWNRAIVRWLIPVPRQECPQCGYVTNLLTTARCPECGYVGIEPQNTSDQR